MALSSANDAKDIGTTTKVLHGDERGAPGAYGPVVLSDLDPALAALLSGSVTIAEVDGTPSSACTKLVFPNGTIVIAAGVATYTPAAAPNARVFHSANQATTSGVTKTLAFDSERWDTDNIHDNVTNNSRLTCNTAGLYVITASVVWTGNVAGNVWIRLNGATIIAAVNVVSGAQYVVATQYQLAVTDYVEVQVQQLTGASNVLSSANYSPEFSMCRIG